VHFGPMVISMGIRRQASLRAFSASSGPRRNAIVFLQDVFSRNRSCPPARMSGSRERGERNLNPQINQLAFHLASPRLSLRRAAREGLTRSSTSDANEAPLPDVFKQHNDRRRRQGSSPFPSLQQAPEV